MPIAAVIGAGLIGRSWAMVFARSGWDVRLTDPLPAARKAAPALIRAALKVQAAHGLARDAAKAAARITIVKTLEDAVRGADLAQECGPETLEVKRDLFARLDAAAKPGAILASSTSAIVASLYTGQLKGRARCLVAHPVNPPHLVPVVELCGAPWTSKATLAKARKIYASLGQAPVLVNKEIEGFILNRLQGAVLAEAFRLVSEGYVSPQDLDRTIKDGLGLRWSFMGPFETIELNAPGGIPDYVERYMGLYRRLAAEPASPEAYSPANAKRIIAAWGGTPDTSELLRKTRWRDRRLAALAAHKARQRDF